MKKIKIYKKLRQKERILEKRIMDLEEKINENNQIIHRQTERIRSLRVIEFIQADRYKFKEGDRVMFYLPLGFNNGYNTKCSGIIINRNAECDMMAYGKINITYEVKVDRIIVGGKIVSGEFDLYETLQEEALSLIDKITKIN